MQTEFARTDIAADQASPSDRRRWPRVEERSRIAVTVVSAPEAPHIESNCYYCWTQDISAGGLRFLVHSSVPLGAILKLQVIFEQPETATFVHIGKVVWEQEFKDNGVQSSWLGVELTETLGGEDHIKQWRRIIDQSGNENA